MSQANTQLSPMSLNDLLSEAAQLTNSDKTKEAVDLLEPYVDQYKSNFDFTRVLGTIYARNSQIDAAVPHLEHALTLLGSYKENFSAEVTELIFNLGQAYYSLHNYEKAAPLFEELCRRDPDKPFNHNRLGRLLNVTSKDERRAIRAFENAIKAQQRLLKTLTDPERIRKELVEFYRFRLNRSFMLLRLGFWLRAWPEFRLRFKVFQMDQQKLSENLPHWNGLEPMEGEQLLLLPEQGIGDCFMTVRYVKLLHEMGIKTVFFGDQRVFRLFEHSKMFTTLVPYDGKLTRPTAKVYLFDLPCIFKATPENIPVQEPYLFAEKGFLKKAKVPYPKGKIKVGIVWGGNPDYPNDWFRSVDLPLWEPVMTARDDVQFYSLQIGARTEALKQVPFGDQIIDLSDKITDFYDTACIINDLDLVISIDTSVAHLAGAMGAKVFTLLPSSPDWRWLLDRPDTVWYRTMRVFRQQTHMQWGNVIEEVREQLIAFDRKKPIV